MLPVNPGTIVATVASCIGLSVSAHRCVSPNRSLSRSASTAEYLRLAGSILIWQRSAIASIRWPVVSAIRRFSVMDGAMAYLSGRAPMQSKASSAMSSLLVVGPGLAADAVEEAGDGLPRLCPAVEAAPEQPQPPGQLVAGVDRDDEGLDLRARPRDQHRLDVGGRGAEQRVVGGQA